MGPKGTLITSGLLGQRGNLFCWVPVCFSCGIGLYFALQNEPSVTALAGLAGAGAVLFALAGWVRRRFDVTGEGLHGACLAMALVALGLTWAGLRTHMMAAPVLGFRYYGAIEGRVVGMDLSGSGALRLTLDRVVLERMNPDETPARVRVSLHGAQGFAPMQPGAHVILTGHLGPPGGAVEPGGYDFRRHAWFLRLGAVGYTRTPVLWLEPPGRGQWVFKARMAISRAVQERLPGVTGGFAAAVTAGDRSALPPEVVEALRDTNLAHLLAISGLHMGLLAGFVFAALRLALVLVPATRHRTRNKAWAAAGALLAASAYLLLSGGTIATRRAYIMVAVALVAVLLDRRALSLRSVALAAMIVLLLQPEALLSPGFQMSFSATTALVAAFDWLSGRQRGWPKSLRGVSAVVISSAVAGAATAPFGMAHFNSGATYGLLANLMATPIMGLVVMPMAVLAALLAPLGLSSIGLWAMALGLDWILWVAEWWAAQPGAVRPVVAPGPWVLPLVSLGGLVLCLGRGPGRGLALLPLTLAVWLWHGATRPALLISDTGTLVGLMTEAGRALSRETGAGFVAEVWLENDGQGLDQGAAAALWPGEQVARIARAPFGAYEIVHLQGKRAVAAFGNCSANQIVVQSTDDPLPGPCLRITPADLRDSGSIAIAEIPQGGPPRMVPASDRAGERLWLGQ